MELILNINQYGYAAFLDSNVDIFVIGLKDFCTGYWMTYEIDEINSVANYVHESNKKLYLSLNKISSQENINELIKKIHILKDLDVDGFVVSDFGVLQVFKDNDLLKQVIFNPVTTITNKYNAKICNDWGIDHVCLPNELNLKEIQDISKYTNGNVELLAQGYYQLCDSKRKLLTLFLKKYENGQTCYIQEETRQYDCPIVELDDDLLIYSDKQRCLLPYISKLMKSEINYIRIDTAFMDVDEIIDLVNIYKNAIEDSSTIQESIDKIKDNEKYNLKCLDNISLIKKEKENE